MQKPSSQIVLKPSPKPIKTSPKPSEQNLKKQDTTEISAKETSPTLVDFQNKNAQLPDWRLQVKNAVLKRKGIGETEVATTERPQSLAVAEVPPNSVQVVSNQTVKPEVIDDIQPSSIENKQLLNALQRIERSRQKFLIVEPDEQVEEVFVELESTEEKPAKEYPFTIASRNDNPTVEAKEDLKTSVNFPTKPQLVPKPKPHKIYQTGDLYDTSELDPDFISAKISSSFEKKTEIVEKPKKTLKKAVIKTDVAEKQKEKTEKQVAVIDDLAPFSLRFNAGLFDFIIGSFASVILLAPFILLGGSWFTIAGFFAFLATTAIVMFIYQTTTVGVFGKTFGMHLFSIEMIDYFDDEYPTFHQAAVSSSIYLLSMTVCGLGFITSLFDEDKRAVHDLVSKTIVVKEI